MLICMCLCLHCLECAALHVPSDSIWPVFEDGAVILKRLCVRLSTQARDGKDVAKSDYQRLAADNSKLERQKSQLLAAFRQVSA